MSALILVVDKLCLIFPPDIENVTNGISIIAQSSHNGGCWGWDYQQRVMKTHPTDWVVYHDSIRAVSPDNECDQSDSSPRHPPSYGHCRARVQCASLGREEREHGHRQSVSQEPSHCQPVTVSHGLSPPLNTDTHLSSDIEIPDTMKWIFKQQH